MAGTTGTKEGLGKGADSVLAGRQVEKEREKDEERASTDDGGNEQKAVQNPRL